MLLSWWPRSGGLADPTGGSSHSPNPVDVALLRDAWGVPHVFAPTERAALYGLGWASAEDRLFQMLRSRLMVQGQSALAGIHAAVPLAVEEADYVDRGLAGAWTLASAIGPSNTWPSVR
jgi:hypothetical protein